MILLLALLCAAPEKVVVVARPHEKPGFFHKLGEAVGKAVRRLHEKNDPDVDEGNAVAAQNDPEGALKSYDRALEHLSDSPELHYDRAGQMLKLGSDHATRAHEEAQKALQTQDRALKASAAFDLALSDEELGNPDQAIKDYQQALTLDPGDEDSKVNLELLLKSQEERKQKQPQQQQESKQKNQQKDQQPDKSKGDQQQQDQQKQAGEKEQKKEEKKEQAGQQQQTAPKEEKKDQQAEEQKPVDRSEAERLLDALRAGEKNLQVWRFAKDKRKETRRSDVEKDW
jgi:Ca-activated chloride channel family protein